jgi:farnesol dehydrogenase
VTTCSTTGASDSPLAESREGNYAPCRASVPNVETTTMNVLVTGGTGYLGRTVVAALAGAGHVPIVFSRHASGSGLPGRLVDGDVCDARAVSGAMRGCDAVIHAAALVSLWRRHPGEFDAVNVGGLRHVLDAASTLGVPRVVYTSSFLALAPAGGAEPVRANDYQRTKVEARAVAIRAIDAGLPLMCVYPGVIYGPGTRTEGNLVGRLLADHLAGRLPGVIGPERLWSFSYVGDVASGHVTALERGRPGAHYGLGGETAPQRRVFELLQAATGVRVPRRIPYAAAHLAGTVEEWRARLTGRPPLVTRGAVEIFRHDWPVDSRAAVADLGYTMTPLATGFAELLRELAPQAASGTRA